MAQQVDPLLTVERIDEARATLTRLLRSADPQRLANRPSSGEWSPIENVRHLLFAEQLHFGRLLDLDQAWSPIGLAPHFLADEPPFRAVGSDPTTDLDDVLDAWETVHESVRRRSLDSSSDMDEALQRNLSHLRHHLNIIESLLSE